MTPTKRQNILATPTSEKSFENKNMLNDEQETPAPDQQAPMRVGTLDQGKVKLPDFVEEHTDLWFWQVEAAFEAAGIVSDKKRYYTIIGQLPTRVMYKLADFLLTSRLESLTNLPIAHKPN